MSDTPTFPAYTLPLAFLMEVAALSSYGLWAWRTVPGALRVPATIALPVALATAWGVFATPQAQVSGSTVVDTPGIVRLGLELGVLGGGGVALHRSGARRAALAYSGALAVHLVATYGRLRWLARH